MIENKPTIAKLNNLSGYNDFKTYISNMTTEELNNLHPNSISDSALYWLHNYQKTLFVKMESWFKRIKESDEEALLRFRKEVLTAYFKKLDDIVDYFKAFNQPVNIYFWGKPSETGHFIAVIGYTFKESVILYDADKFFTPEFPMDYRSIPLGELKQTLLSGGVAPATSLIPTGAESLSVSDINKKEETLASDLNSLKSDMEAVKRGQAEGLKEMQEQLEALQAQLEEKKSVMLAELNEKKSLMEAQMEQFSQQLMVLESEIYNIECFLGETITFSTIRSGKNALDTEPVVLYQKLRFLDEELGKLASFYEIDWDELNMFELFLKNSPYAEDVFFPNPRCVTLVKLSKHNTILGYSEKYLNQLENYKRYHGETVGIIIRNGDNVYLGWCDEEKITIDDDFVMEPKSTIIEPLDNEYKEPSKDEKYKTFKEMSSRIFLFSILQGVSESKTPLLPMPEKVVFFRQSEYVKFALADTWLPDNRFGTFSDIIKKCNSSIKKDDMVISVINLYAEQPKNYSSWSNDRGRGDRNRTHDVQVENNSLYPINLIEEEENPIDYVDYRYKNLSGDWVDARTIYSDNLHLNEDCEIIDVVRVFKKHYFVSCVKEYSGKNARANFEVYPNEIINLAFMNTAWLSYTINSKNLGGWIIGGRPVDYGYGIQYLNSMMQYVRNRENQEAILIAAAEGGSDVLKNPDWPWLLSEWKIAHNVHKMTDFQAKRFVKSFSN